MYKLKDEFNLVQDWVYLDNAASTPPMKCAITASEKFLKTYGSVHRGTSFMSEVSTNMYEDARNSIQNVIDPNNRGGVIFTSNSTDGLNKLSLMFDLKNKKILIPEHEHSSNLLPWQKRAQDKNNIIILKNTPFVYSKINLEALEYTIKKYRPFCLTFAIATNVSGIAYTFKEMKDIYEICNKYGVLVFHDASQFVAHYKYSFDYADAVCFAGHKMYAPFGIGCLVLKKDLFGSDYNIITGGGNVENIEYSNISDSKYSKILNIKPIYKKSFLQYETGTPNAIGAVALAAVFKRFAEIGFNEIETHTKELCSYINKELLMYDSLGNTKQTPILILKNTPKLAKELIKNKVAYRVGEFCVYSLFNALQLKPSIRLSAGATTEIEDLEKLKRILLYANL